jgi:short subunit dehydrogenase-like uncharacterized protein
VPGTRWLIYGATGYTGRLVTAAALARGLDPILGGRDVAAVTALAGEHGLEPRPFALDDSHAVSTVLDGVGIVAHCAGPFSATSGPMLDACLAAGADYVDITGEIAVFEAAFARHDAARAAGIVVCPGVGFDVIPTDCVAACLKEALPDATRLALGFETTSGMSAGTAKTSVEALKVGSQIRRDGRLECVPLGGRSRTINFGRGPRHAVAIPWGDLATAYRTTGIPTIEVYVPMPRVAALGLRLVDVARGLLGGAAAQAWLKGAIEKRVRGPGAAARESSPTRVWGEVTSPDGRTAVARLRTANVYDVTVSGVLMAVAYLLDRTGPGGTFTPSQLMGSRCVEQLPGSGRIAITTGRS